MPSRFLLAILAACVFVAPVRGEEPVLVSITGPLVGRVGDRVSFEAGPKL